MSPRGSLLTALEAGLPYLTLAPRTYRRRVCDLCGARPIEVRGTVINVGGSPVGVPAGLCGDCAGRLRLTRQVLDESRHYQGRGR